MLQLIAHWYIHLDSMGILSCGRTESENGRAAELAVLAHGGAESMSESSIRRAGLALTQQSKDRDRSL